MSQEANGTCDLLLVEEDTMYTNLRLYLKIRSSRLTQLTCLEISNYSIPIM